MIDIKLKNGDHLITDKHNWIFQKSFISKKTGKKELRDESFFPNLECAIEHLMDLYVKDNEITTIKEIADKVEKVKMELIEACKNYVKE